MIIWIMWYVFGGCCLLMLGYFCGWIARDNEGDKTDIPPEPGATFDGETWRS
jgi:hypothetical protein